MFNDFKLNWFSILETWERSGELGDILRTRDNNKLNWLMASIEFDASPFGVCDCWGGCRVRLYRIGELGKLFCYWRWCRSDASCWISRLLDPLWLTTILSATLAATLLLEDYWKTFRTHVARWMVSIGDPSEGRYTRKALRCAQRK